jgi:hypothetical protein
LPYSIVRGEEFVFKATLFNYIEDTTTPGLDSDGNGAKMTFDINPGFTVNTSTVVVV